MIYAVIAFVVVLSWLVGKSIDINKIDIEECLDCVRVAPDGSRPFWVKKGLFNKCRFYDWSKLESHQWTKLHDAILDFYEHIENGQVDVLEEDTIFKYAMINEDGIDSFVASCSILLLMIVDTDIMASYDRFNAFNTRLESLKDRYTKEKSK